MEELKYKNDFKHWLQKKSKSEDRLQPRTASSYCSYISKVWSSGIDVKEQYEVLEKREHSNKELSETEIRNGISALKQYYKFSNDSWKPRLKLNYLENSININVVNFIQTVDFTEYFRELRGATQKIKADAIKKLQKKLVSLLNSEFEEDYDFSDEEGYLKEGKDKLDIVGFPLTEGNPLIVIELDKTFAQQVAKKSLGRMGGLLDDDLNEKFKNYNKSCLYISLCYPGTPKMPRTENEKYMRFTQNICREISKGGTYKFEYAGLLIEPALSEVTL